MRTAVVELPLEVDRTEKNFLQEGIAAAKAGDKVSARMLLQRMVEQDPTSEIAWLWLAFMADGNQEFIGYLRRVLAINPHNEQALESLHMALLNEGVRLAKEGNKSQANWLLKEASSLKPNSELVWLWLASVAEKSDEAVRSLQRVLKLNPKNEQALTWLKQLDAERSILQPTTVAQPAQEAQTAPEPQAPPPPTVIEPVLSVVPPQAELEPQPPPVAHSDRLEAATVMLAAAPAPEPTPAPEPVWEAEASWEAPLSVESQTSWEAQPLPITPPPRPMSRQPLREVQPLRDAGAVLTQPTQTFQPRLVRPVPQAWHCPLCATPAQTELSACPSCRAILTLTDLDAITANREAAKEIMQDALRRFQSLAEEDGDFISCFYMGVAHLNLNQVAEALPWLRKASSLRPEDQALKTQLAALQQRQKRPQSEHIKTILVIDDSATVCKLVAVALEKWGHRVVAASEMMDALARINETKFDLILLDIVLPGMDGYQICKIIKGYPSTKDVPVVMLSGKDGFFDKVRARMVGAQGYITKPFVPNDLIKAVESYCKVKRK